LKCLHTLLLLLLLSLSFLPTFVAEAGEPPDPPSTFRMDSFRMDLPAGYRLSWFGVTAVDAVFADRDTVALPREAALHHRLRIAPGFSYERGSGFLRLVKVKLEGDLLDRDYAFSPVSRDVLTFETRPRDGSGLFDADNILLRQAYVVVATTAGYVKIGRQVSNWGLGLVANDGAARPMAFGMSHWGDVVDRAQLVVKPVGLFTRDPKRNPLYLVGAVDRVWRDDTANQDQDGHTFNFIGSALVRFPWIEGGFYMVRRHQAFREQPLAWDCEGGSCALDTGLNAERLETQAWVLDAFLAVERRFGPVRVYGAGEAAWILGNTELFRNADIDRHRLEEVGFVARAGVEYGMADLRLELGYASGDTDSGDDRIRGFSFDRDYRVGLVLFPQYLARLTAISAWNLSRPEHSYMAPAGVSHLPTDGALTNALYVNPVLKLAPTDRVHVLIGLLWAQAEERAYDPFQSNMVAGSEVKGWRGAPRKRALGWEVDLAVGYDWDLAGWTYLRTVLEAGWLRPGDAFETADGTAARDAGMVQARFELGW